VKIYLDTNLWNLSCDQCIDAPPLLHTLQQRGNSLVLGIHAVYELAKTFYSDTEAAKQRGKSLFRHLHSYLSDGLRLVMKETSETLAAEMYELQRLPGSEKFLGADDLSKVCAEVQRLAAGETSDLWRQHTTDRMRFAERTRAELRAHLASRPELINKLKSVAASQLSTWLTTEATSHGAVIMLTGHIGESFPDAQTIELLQYAAELIRNPSSLIARAVVRADLYCNWRCANRGSNPPDLADDLYHVLNATYCDIYATDDRRQAEYACYILPAGTQVAVYDRAVPLDNWLLSL
jgi:hypothetical protein